MEELILFYFKAVKTEMAEVRSYLLIRDSTNSLRFLR